MRKAILLFTIFIVLSIFICSCADTTPTDTDNVENDKAAIPATIDVLKIGKADCIVINTGSKIVMIDTGEEENLHDIESYMTYNNYQKIDTLILTHYDKDHIGSASEVISKYNVTTVIETQGKTPTAEYLKYHSTMAEKGITPLKLTKNYKFTYDSCEFEVDIPKQTKYSENRDNNLSLIVSMKCGEKNFLFCADAAELRLEEFINQNQTDYDFIKSPYHGNYIENYEELINSVKPEYVAITDSKKNTASVDMLAILYNKNIEVYETRYGEINVFTDGKQITITQKGLLR